MLSVTTPTAERCGVPVCRANTQSEHADKNEASTADNKHSRKFPWAEKLRPESNSSTQTNFVLVFSCVCLCLACRSADATRRYAPARRGSTHARPASTAGPRHLQAARSATTRLPGPASWHAATAAARLPRWPAGPSSTPAAATAAATAGGPAGR